MRRLDRASWGTLCIVSAYLVLAVFGVQQAVAKTPTCPNLTGAQVSKVTGFKYVSVNGHAASDPTQVNCFYTLGKTSEAGMTFKAWAGAKMFATEKATIDENIGTINMDDDDSAPTPCTAAWGQCKGKKYNGHESPLGGLGSKAIGFPGNKQAGAFVMFIWNGMTLLAESNGPYGNPGPNEGGLKAFARLVIHSHFSL